MPPRLALAALTVAALAGCGTDVAGRMAKVLGTTPVADCQARFEKGDGDKSGQLSPEEFAISACKPSKTVPK